MVVVLLCITVGIAIASEDAPIVRKQITEARFAKLVGAIEDDDPTTLEFRDRVREIARKHYVRRSGKVFDIKPLASGSGPIVDIECIGEFGGPPQETFTVAGSEAQIVSSWRRWDRVSWICDISVDDAGTVTLRRRFFSVDDLERTPNPGLRYPPPEKPLQRIGKFPEWLLRYASKTSDGQWSAAWRMYDRARKNLWGIQGTVAEVRADAPFIRCDIDRHVAVRSRHDGLTWGITQKTHSVQIADPQVIDVLAIGDAVELRLDMDGVESLETFRGSLGALPINLAFGRLMD